MSKKNQKKQHIGLAVDLLSSIGNEAMVDIVLTANDGGETPASRFVLGARSSVLQKMLFSEGQMGGSTELKLDYSTNVVRTLWHYCRTNELDQIWHAKDEAAARELVKLCDCANSFELEGLTELVSEQVASLTKTHPHLACAIYDEAAAHEESVETLKHIAQNAIRQNPEAALLRRNEFGNRYPGVASLGPAVVEDILSDPLMCTEEINMFRAVAFWADARTSIEGVSNVCLDDTFDSAAHVQPRRLLAKQITARCIDLSKIAPSELLGIVTDSGLVDAMSVSNALIQLALRIEKEGVLVSKRRAQGMGQEVSPPPFKSSKSAHEKAKTQLEDNSVVDESDDCTEASSYKTAPVNNKKRSSIKLLPEVTPQKTQKPRVATTPSSVVQEDAQDSSPRRRPMSIREAMGHFLADKVDTLCLHPYDAKNEKK
jgi:hypothetical protein